jgi:outer membrane protein TolC
MEEHKGVRGFLDPRLAATAGYSDWAREVPGATLVGGVPENSVTAKGGVEAPFLPGGYLSVGASEYRLLDPGQELDDLYQSLLGAQLAFPVGKDRFFAKFRSEDRAALERVNAAAQRLVSVQQDVRHEVELACIDLLKALAEEDTVASASKRVEKLLEEAKELVRLKVIPEYQVFPARLNVDLYREEKAITSNLWENGMTHLAELLGQTEPPVFAANAGLLMDLLARPDARGEISLEEACRRRGAHAEILSLARAAEADVTVAREDVKPDVNLAVGGTWQGDSPDNLLGTELVVTEDHFAAEAVVTWKQPLGRRKERATVAAREADVQALLEKLRQERLRIASEMAAARSDLRAAHARVESLNAAVEEATRTLSAEEERFRLGEGRSRNVLDAQQDLTSAIRRRNVAAAALLRARADWRYATGYAEEIGAPAAGAKEEKP